VESAPAQRTEGSVQQGLNFAFKRKPSQACLITAERSKISEVNFAFKRKPSQACLITAERSNISEAKSQHPVKSSA